MQLWLESSTGIDKMALNLNENAIKTVLFSNSFLVRAWCWQRRQKDEERRKTEPFSNNICKFLEEGKGKLCC